MNAKEKTTNQTTSSASAPIDLEAWSAFPGAQAPDRRRAVDAFGVEIAVVEWGKESDPIVLLAHGGADFARTFDGFAPLIAAGGYRVVSWDHRSHGNSEWAALQSWEADCRDALCVLHSCLEGRPQGERAFAVGHSKGGGLMTHLCVVHPELFHCLVNIDGVPSVWRYSKSEAPVSERVQKRHKWQASFLDHRAKAHSAVRRPGTPEELVARRQKHNPRLSVEWLRYLMTVGARESADGWRWKLDPLVRMGGPGPWRPEWGIKTMSAVSIPMLAVLGFEQEPMGWGTKPDEAKAVLPEHAELLVLEDSGHFVHIEHPQRTADTVLRFLKEQKQANSSAAEAQPAFYPGTLTPTLHGSEPRSSSSPATRVQHGRVSLALHQLRDANDSAHPPLLCIHELGGSGADFDTGDFANWPGPVWTLDLCGHGRSQAAAGGGYAPEWLFGDIEVATARLVEQTETEDPYQASTVALLGKGLGAYAALLYAGIRPERVAAAVLVDGEGLAGGGAEPVAPSKIALPGQHASQQEDEQATDPLALAELSGDIRPPGYTGVFARQIKHLNPLAADEVLPIWWAGSTETPPEWLASLLPQLRRCDGESAGVLEMSKLVRSRPHSGGASQSDKKQRDKSKVTKAVP